MGKNITLRSTDPDDPEVVKNIIIDGGGSGSVVTFRSGRAKGQSWPALRSLEEVAPGKKGELSHENIYRIYTYIFIDNPS